MRDKAVDLEYGGLVGNTDDILDRINKCTMAARLTSEFPIHMTRPQRLSSEYRTLGKRKRRFKLIPNEILL